MSDKIKVPRYVYLFPTKIFVVFDETGQQINDLQGKYSKELHRKILDRSDQLTHWNMKDF